MKEKAHPATAVRRPGLVIRRAGHRAGSRADLIASGHQAGQATGDADLADTTEQVRLLTSHSPHPRKPDPTSILVGGVSSFTEHTRGT